MLQAADHPILIAESDPARVGSLHTLLAEQMQGQGDVVQLDAVTGDETIAMVREQGPDLLILDAFLQQPSGLDVCRQLRAQGQQLPIIMVSASQESIDCVVSLEVGADDFVRRPLEVRELMARARAHLRRVDFESRPFEREVLECGELRIDLLRRQVFRGDVEISLTVTEFNLLALLASSAGRVLSRHEMLQRVWGYEGNIETRTVDAHVYRLRHKIEPDPGTPIYIHSVAGIGYRMGF